MPDKAVTLSILGQIEEHFRRCNHIYPDWVFEGYEAAVRDAITLMQDEPKVSEWLEDSDPGQEYGTTWACRKCMHSIHEPFVWNPYNSGYKYCPHCGAKMEVIVE